MFGRLRQTDYACVAERLVWSAALIVTPAAAIAQGSSNEPPPVLGIANLDNEYQMRRTLVASFDLDADPSPVILGGDAVFTTAPSEVISGARSVRLSGESAFVEIDYTALQLEPHRIYALEYDYRIIDDAGAESATFVIGRWGAASDHHGDPWGLPPRVFGPEGTQQRQFRFGALGYPTFLIFSTTPGVVIVDNLRVWRLDAEAVRSSPPILALGFPRLGNYFYGSPYAQALTSGLNASDIEEMIGRFDLITGVQIDHTIGDTGWIERILDRNPAAIILPYRLSYSAQNIDRVEPVGGTSDLEALFNRAIPPAWIMRGPDGEPLHDQIFDGNTQLDPTSYCEPVNNLVFSEFMERFIGDTVLPAGLWSGIHFDQAEWYPNPLLAQTINGPLPPFDIDRDGIPDSMPFMFTETRRAFHEYFDRMSKRFGYSRILFGNPGRIPLDATVLADLNGWQQELLCPYDILAGGEWDTTRSAQWHDFLRNYLAACSSARAPRALNIQFTGRDLGVPTGGITGHGLPDRIPELEPRDYHRMRLGLATTLLGNGFFGYDLVDNTTPPVWFDEFALDDTGHPTTALSGKGYLGQPLADATEITRPASIVLETGFEGEVPPGLFVGEDAVYTTVPWQVIEGLASLVVSSPTSDKFIGFITDPQAFELEQGTTYDLVAHFRVLEYTPEEFGGLLKMGIASDPFHAIDFHGQSFVYHQDVQAIGQTITMRSQVKVTTPGAMAYALIADRGSIAIDSIRLTELAGGAFRRDFEGGIALVNPTPEPITLTQAEVAGPFARTTIRRISGVQDPAVNSGEPVIDGLTIPPADGIILLAGRIDAPAPVTPPALFALPDASEAAVDLYFDTAQGGTRAGSLVEYKLADGPAWDRFDLAGPDGVHRIEFLDPGTEYEARIANYDDAGRVSAFTDPVRFTTTGTTPVRPHIESIGTMERGGYALLTGDTLADSALDLSTTLPFEFEGTSVRINGVPAQLAFASPESLAFIVPPSVAIGDAIVRVLRGSTTSAGHIAAVVAPPAACPGDINGDNLTNAADFIIQAGHFGSAVAPNTSGDLNGDGLVSAADFVILAGDFGCSIP